MRRALLRSTFLALLIVGALALPLAAQPTPVLTAIKFGNLGPSPHQLAIYVADREGFFRDEGLRVSTVSVGTASNVASLLAAGEFQIANDGADSYIVAIARHDPLKIIGTEVTTNPYHLITVPSVTSWAQLEGKSVAVGPTQDGDAVLGFYAMLVAQHRNSSKFTMLGGGNSKQRFEALQLGSVQGALLAEPYDLLGVARGMRSLATAHDLVDNDWMSTSIGVNATWAAANRRTVVHFMHAACKAVVFAYAHRTETVAILVNETGEDQSTVERFYDRYFAQWHAIDPHLALSASALARVERMMRLAGMLKTFPSNAEVIDPSYGREARC